MFNTLYTSSSTYALPYKVSPIYTDDVSIYQHLKNSTLLDNFLSLPKNWNGYGAEEFTPDFIAAVKKVVFKLNKTPKIFPTGRNTIQFEYEKENGDYLELEIFQDGSVTALQVIGDDEKESKIKVTEINNVLQSFYAI